MLYTCTVHGGSGNFLTAPGNDTDNCSKKGSSTKKCNWVKGVGTTGNTNFTHAPTTDTTPSEGGGGGSSSGGNAEQVHYTYYWFNDDGSVIKSGTETIQNNYTVTAPTADSFLSLLIPASQGPVFRGWGELDSGTVNIKYYVACYYAPRLATVKDMCNTGGISYAELYSSNSYYDPKKCLKYELINNCNCKLTTYPSQTYASNQCVRLSDIIPASDVSVNYNVTVTIINGGTTNSINVDKCGVLLPADSYTDTYDYRYPIGVSPTTARITYGTDYATLSGGELTFNENADGKSIEISADDK